MADPSSLTISIDRTSMTLDAFLICGHDEPTRDLSLTAYREPSMQARITNAPTGDGHGEMPLGWSYQEVIHSFNVFDEAADTETEMRAKIAELTAALGRLIFPITVTVADAAPETWTCRAGSISPVDDRNSYDLQDHRAAWAVTIPAYPVRSV